MANIPEGTYRLECVGYDSENPRRVLDLKGSSPAPGTPIICWPRNSPDTSNQKWYVTKFNGGYNFQALDPPSNAFVGSIGPGEPVTGTPLQMTAFKLNDAGGSNLYQIVAESNGRKYALTAPNAAGDTITLRPLDATNPKQVWRFVTLN